MSLLFTEGFDCVDQESMFFTWRRNSDTGHHNFGPSALTRHGFGKFLRVWGSHYTNPTFTKVVENDDTTLILGCAIKLTGTMNDIRFYLKDDTYVGAITTQYNGHYDKSRFAVLCMGTWYYSDYLVKQSDWVYLELKFFCDPVSGILEVRLDQQTVILEEDINTGGGNPNKIMDKIVIAGGRYTSSQFDDLYVANGAGSNNNDFLGDTVVISKVPNASGDQTNWIPSSGANFSCLNNNPIISPAGWSKVHTAESGHISNHLLTKSCQYGNHYNHRSNFTISKTGKWYWEMSVDVRSTSYEIGIVDSTSTDYLNDFSDNSGYSIDPAGNKCSSSGSEAYGSSYVTDDIIGFALDMDNRKLWFSINGVWQNNGDPELGTGAAFDSVADKDFQLAVEFASAHESATMNLGASFFSHSIPTGFLALAKGISDRYVTSSVSGTTDLYNMEDLDIDITGIKGIVCRSIATKMGAGTREFKTLAKVDGTIYEASELISLSHEYSITSGSFDVNPSTGLAWTKSELNNIQLGMTIV